MSTTAVDSQLLHLAEGGVDIMLHFHRDPRSNEDLAHRYGMPILEVKRIRWSAQAFFRAGEGYLELARSYKLSLDYLKRFRTYVNKLVDAEKTLGTFFDQAIRIARDFTCEVFDQKVKELIHELNGGQTKRRAEVFHISSRPDEDNMCYVNGKFSAEDAAAMHRTLYPYAKAIAKLHGVPMQQALATALKTAVLKGTKPHSAHGFSPCIMVPLGDATYLKDGRFLTSDGAIIRLEDFIGQEVADTGYVVIAARDHNGLPTIGGVLDIERTDGPGHRFANSYQRLLCSLLYPICQHPDCHTIAAVCEAHHVQAAATGGPTETDNLTMLCPHHNKRNNDFPRANNDSGRVERQSDGRVGFRRTPGADLEFNGHPIMTRSAINWLHRMFPVEE